MPARSVSSFEARQHAARLQEKLGISVSAGSANCWQGYYFIVDWDDLEILAGRLKEMKDALKFYANGDNYFDEYLDETNCPVVCPALGDEGKTAREALDA